VAPDCTCKNTVVHCLWKPKHSLFSLLLTAQVGAGEAKNFGSYNSMCVNEREKTDSIDSAYTMFKSEDLERQESLPKTPLGFIWLHINLPQSPIHVV
jgi:hypothetical protein